MKTKILFVVALVAWLSAPALAAMPVGDPYEGDSWSIGFEERAGGGPQWAAGPFDTIVVYMSGGPETFESPGMSNFSGSNWHVVAQTDQYVVAKGDVISTGSFTWTFTFTGDSFDNPQSGEMQYVALLGDLVQLHQEFDVPGFGWDLGTQDDLDVVLPLRLIPLPAPVWLGMAGLAGVVVLRRRKTG